MSTGRRNRCRRSGSRKKFAKSAPSVLSRERRNQAPRITSREDGAILQQAQKELFLWKFLKLEHGPPSHDTFSRVFRLLDPEQFGACFQRFMARFAEACHGVVAIDGKVVRRSFDRASGKSALHMISAWGCDQRLVLAQVATDAKSNEITAVPMLLRLLCLKGTIVTVDALNRQREIARQIIEQGGDYAMALKGNQGTLHDDVRAFLDDPKAEATTTNTTVDGDHGRIETRTAVVSTHIDWLQEQHQWPGLKAVAKVTRNRESADKTSSETAFYLLSQPLTADRFNPVARAHWGVERRLHWCLDVQMSKTATEPERTMDRRTLPSFVTWPSTSCEKIQEKSRSAPSSK